MLKTLWFLGQCWKLNGFYDNVENYMVFRTILIIFWWWRQSCQTLRKARFSGRWTAYDGFAFETGPQFTNSILIEGRRCAWCIFSELKIHSFVNILLLFDLILQWANICPGSVFLCLIRFVGKLHLQHHSHSGNGD